MERNYKSAKSSNHVPSSIPRITQARPMTASSAKTAMETVPVKDKMPQQQRHSSSQPWGDSDCRRYMDFPHSPAHDSHRTSPPPRTEWETSLQTPEDIFFYTPRGIAPSSISSSSNSSFNDSRRSSTIHKARAVMSGMMGRNRSQARNLRNPYKPTATSYGTISEYNFDPTSNHEEALTHDSSSILTTTDQDSSYSTPSSERSDEYTFLLSGGYRSLDRGPQYQDPWWQIDFDEWSLWIGVYLMGSIIVMVVCAAAAYIWILLHQ